MLCIPNEVIYRSQYLWDNYFFQSLLECDRKDSLQSHPTFHLCNVNYYQMVGLSNHIVWRVSYTCRTTHTTHENVQPFSHEIFIHLHSVNYVVIWTEWLNSSSWKLKVGGRPMNWCLDASSIAIRYYEVKAGDIVVRNKLRLSIFLIWYTMQTQVDHVINGHQLAKRFRKKKRNLAIPLFFTGKRETEEFNWLSHKLAKSNRSRCIWGPINKPWCQCIRKICISYIAFICVDGNVACASLSALGCSTYSTFHTDNNTLQLKTHTAR